MIHVWSRQWQAVWLVSGLGIMSLGAGATLGQEGTRSFELTSDVFAQGQAIPSKYTCDGDDVSPPLAWTDPPAGTKSLALISDDPDAPVGTWVHWVLYNLPPATRQLREALPTDEALPDGTRQGLTDFKRTGYGGPCPPGGTHRYFFTLYALDATLPLPPAVGAKQLEQAMQGHILAQAQLMGTYRRQGR